MAGATGGTCARGDVLVVRVCVGCEQESKGKRERKKPKKKTTKDRKEQKFERGNVIHSDRPSPHRERLSAGSLTQAQRSTPLRPLHPSTSLGAEADASDPAVELVTIASRQPLSEAISSPRVLDCTLSYSTAADPPVAISQREQIRASSEMHLAGRSAHDFASAMIIRAATRSTSSHAQLLAAASPLIGLSCTGSLLLTASRCSIERA